MNTEKTKKDPNDLMGRAVRYFDYLDTERFGHIVGVEPYPGIPDLAYIYIEDNEDEFNTHQDIINGKVIRYAEMRTSDEVYLDE